MSYIKYNMACLNVGFRRSGFNTAIEPGIEVNPAAQFHEKTKDNTRADSNEYNFLISISRDLELLI